MSFKDSRPVLFTKDLLLLVISSTLFFGSLYLLLNDLPSFVVSLGGGDADIGLATGAFALTGMLTRPLVGWLLDHIGRKPVLVAGNVVFAISPLLYALPRTVPGLIAVRLFHGVGIALFTTAGLTMVTDLVVDSRRGEALGLFQSAQLAAIALAPGLGALLVGTGGLLALIPAAAVAAAASLLVASLVRHPRQSGTARNTPRLVHIARQPGVLAAAVGAVVVGTSYAGVTVFLPLVSPGGASRVGLFFLLYAVVSLIVRTPTGRLSDQIGRWTLLMPGVGLISAALLLIPWATSPLLMAGAALLYGLGFGSAYPLLGAMATDWVPESMRGTVLGIYSGSFDAGLMLGSVTGGAVGSLGHALIFLTMAGMVLAGLGCARLLWAMAGRRDPRVASQPPTFDVPSSGAVS